MKVFNGVHKFMINLTHWQGLIIAFLTSFILTSLFFLKNSGLHFILVNFTAGILSFLIVMLPIAIIIYYLLYVYCIYPHSSSIEFERELHTAKQEIIDEYNLTKENFTEVKFLFENHFEKYSDDDDSAINHIILPILNNSNYKFLVKLIDGKENEEIKLVVTDINDNIIHITTIANFIYFQSNFKKIN